jgi:transcriptional regulator with XRE-family HTH domain
MTRAKSEYDVLLESADARRLLRQEELILEVTEALAGALQQSGTSKVELAKRLGKSRAFVSQVLSGGRNLTLRTIADLADALDCRLVMKACPRDRRFAAPIVEVVGWERSLYPEQWNEPVNHNAIENDHGTTADDEAAA